MSKCYQHQCRNGKSLKFFSNSLVTSSQYHFPKQVDPNLASILLNPEKISDIRFSHKHKKIFLGFGGKHPSNIYRYPVWIPVDTLFSHILVGGSIGSGKSTLITRLLAGSLNCGLTAVIGEAKSDMEINPQAAAFSRLTPYLSNHFGIQSYRWTRGNCYFNPLLYLANLSARKTFLNSIVKQINGIEGELKGWVYGAADIGAYILELLYTISYTPELQEQVCTLRKLLDLIREPEQVEMLIDFGLKHDDKNKHKINEIKRKLGWANFFNLKTPGGREKFAMTLKGINLFADMLDEEDLLYYSEPHTKDKKGNPLVKLELDDILYNQALVVISQPLAANHPSAKIVGAIFWDALLNYTLSMGLNPPSKNGKQRQGLAVFLDETHRLPVGSLGDAGDFLREFKIGLIEITPAVVDQERWNKNKHVYQTIISISPGVPEVCNLIHERLSENTKPPLEIDIGIKLNAQKSIEIQPHIIDNRRQQTNYNDPGVSVRALRNTGQYTALLYTDTIRDGAGLFWLDLENSILANLQNLLEDANAGDKTAAKLVAYALGLTPEFVRD